MKYLIFGALAFARFQDFADDFEISYQDSGWTQSHSADSDKGVTKQKRV